MSLLVISAGRAATALPAMHHAEGGIRTPMGLRPLRPERSASTSSTTSAHFTSNGAGTGIMAVPAPPGKNDLRLSIGQIAASPGRAGLSRLTRIFHKHSTVGAAPRGGPCSVRAIRAPTGGAPPRTMEMDWWRWLAMV